MWTGSFVVYSVCVLGAVRRCPGAMSSLFTYQNSPTTAQVEELFEPVFSEEGSNQYIQELRTCLTGETSCKTLKGFCLILLILPKNQGTRKTLAVCHRSRCCTCSWL